MGKCNSLALLVGTLVAVSFFAGCVERRLTINTEPQGAIVVLNDEEVGTSPVTVSFEWYGDYNVEIRKEGFATLKTHRKLQAPWYDALPFDFFAQVISSDRIVDSYEWTFELEEKRQIDRQALLRNAEELKKQVNSIQAE
ncbi:MAG TPA: PEGA domain-containing protein [Sedimentisphaerales bacterium]|nr:PEGA domain-containing protein [Sedimentisphaerales bacterium]